MSFIHQLNARRKSLKRTIPEIAGYIAMQPSNLYRVFAAERDMRGSTLDALAAALDAQWMLVPKHVVPQVERLLSGKSVGPDDAPSSIERMLGEPE
jgi:hypothetical protein